MRNHSRGGLAFRVSAPADRLTAPADLGGLRSAQGIRLAGLLVLFLSTAPGVSQQAPQNELESQLESPDAKGSSAGAGDPALDLSSRWDPMENLEATEPADGKWLVDEEGREYFVTRLPKEANTYKRAGDGSIVYYGVYRWPVVKETDEHFYIRYYKGPDPEEVEAMREERRRAEAERLARIEASYEIEELAHVDRVVLEPFDEGLPPRGQWRQGLEVADMDGDGELDIVHAPPRKGSMHPVVFLGDGDGRWRYWQEARWPQAPYDYGDVAVGDLDRDGRMDLALGVHLRGLLAMVQEEPGRFRLWSDGLTFGVPGEGSDATSFSSRAVELADWDGDGLPDLVALGEGARQMRQIGDEMEGLPLTSSYGFVLYRNRGDGSWELLSGGVTSGVFGDSLALGDFDDDGRIDGATVSYASGNREILFLNRSGEGGEAWEQGEIPSLREGSWIFGITSGDFDADGALELVTSFYNSHGDTPRIGLEYSWRDAEGAWQTRLFWVAEKNDAMWSLASGDLDGDGNLDVVGTTQWGGMWIFLGDGTGRFLLEETPEIEGLLENCRGYGLELVDLDGDGRSEIVASFAGETGEIDKYLGRKPCPGEGALRVWRPRPRQEQEGSA